MPLSGKEMLKLYELHGWRFVRQSGSHARVKKDQESDTIPMHKELSTGTEAKLLKRLREAG